MYILRELERNDMARINRWRNDPQVIALLGAPFRYINAEADEAWFDSYVKNRGNAVRCAVVREDNAELVGLVSLTNINYMNQSAQFHIMVGDEEKQNCGVGTFAVQAMLEHAFYNMNIHRVELTVWVSNQRAQHVYEKCGFKREGLLRQVYFKQGKFEDAYQYAVLREEYGIKNICPPLSGNMPSFCITKLPQGEGRGKIIKDFDSVFVEPLTQRKGFLDTLYKINTYATFLVAYGTDIKGVAAFYCNDHQTKTAYLTLIAVKKKYQLQHIGRRLLRECEEISLLSGMCFLKLEVLERNYNAIQFYCKNGFNKTEKCSESSFYMVKRLA